MKSKSQRSLNDLRDKATIALHADFKLDEVSPTIKATEICQNVPAARSLFNVLVSNSQVALSCKTILDTKQATISLRKKQQPFHGKRANKTTFAGTHTQRLRRNVRRTGSRRCALRTFQNSSTPSSLYITIKHRKMFYRIFVKKRSVFSIIPLKIFLSNKNRVQRWQIYLHFVLPKTSLNTILNQP